MARMHRLIISVSSLERSLPFYVDALGMTVAESAPPLAHLSSGDGGAEVLLHERPADPSLAGVAPGFLVDDVDRAVAAMEEAGGEVVKAATDQPWGERTAVIRDPDGHIVVVASRVGN